MERDGDDRGRVGRPASRSSAAPTASGPAAPEAGRVVVVGGRAVPAPVAGGQPPPARRRGRSGPARPGSPRPSRASAMAVPDTIDTSCSADGPPSSTTGPAAVRSCATRPSTWSSRRGTRSRNRARRRGGRRPRPGPAPPGGARPPRVPFWSLTMKLACFSETTAPPIRSPLSPAASIRRPAESPGGLRKTLPADGSPSGWWAWRQRRISSSRALIVVRVGRRQPERGLHDELGRRVRRAVLEAAVAVGQRRGPRPGAPPRCPSAARTRADSRTAAMSGSCAPALAQTAPPTVPGMASPNSSPVSPARCVSVAARAICTPASAM